MLYCFRNLSIAADKPAFAGCQVRNISMQTIFIFPQDIHDDTHPFVFEKNAGHFGSRLSDFYRTA
jgi:hypothetical protein